MKLRHVHLLIALSMLAIVVGCAKNNSSQNFFKDNEFSANEEDAQARLKEIIREQITAAGTERESAVVPVIYRRPYYFKEYAFYPDGTDGFEATFRKNDSRTAPLMAEVKMNKVRYSTQMYRKHDQAAADNNFFKDTGVETLVFEWHNGRWSRIGGIFDAQTTEEKVGDEWVPRKEETVRVNPDAEKRGWFGRMWERIRGGE